MAYREIRRVAPLSAANICAVLLGGTGAFFVMLLCIVSVFYCIILFSIVFSTVRSPGNEYADEGKKVSNIRAGRFKVL